MTQVDSSRRDFLTAVAVLGAAGVTGGCATTPSSAPPKSRASVQRRALKANDTIQCGFVGIGSRGSSLLKSVLAQKDVEVVAVCDIYDVALNAALDACRVRVPGVRSYVRFEDMLAHEKLDAVVIATPDHIHAPVILAALDHGMDVYTEKPMTLTADDARRVRDRARETGAVIQVGTQLRSMPMYQKARDVARSGGIGKLVAVQVNRHVGGGGKKKLADTINEQHVSWDLFLRNTKRYPFDPNRFANWRRYVDYSNGAAGDLMLHHLDICHFITGCSMPDRVMSVGGVYFLKDGRTCPDTISALLEYPEEFHFNFITTYVNGHYGLVERYLGSEGTIEVRDMGEMSIIRGDKTEIVPSAGVLNEPHLEDFFRCMRTRQTTIAPVDAGFMGAACCHMAVLSQRNHECVSWNRMRERPVM